MTNRRTATTIGIVCMAMCSYSVFAHPRAGRGADVLRILLLAASCTSFSLVLIDVLRRKKHGKEAKDPAKDRSDGDLSIAKPLAPS